MDLKSFFKRVWQKWLRVGKIIGHYNTKLLLGLMFYTVFTVYGLVAKLLRKDFLDLKMREGAVSYWTEKEGKEGEGEKEGKGVKEGEGKEEEERTEKKKEEYFKQY